MPKPPFGKQDGRMASSYSFKTIIMRNHLLSLLVALLAVTGSLPVAAQEAYAVLTPDGTLTFYYDNQRATRPNYEPIYDMPTSPWGSPAWAGDYNRQNIKHVVFDTSFSGYRPSRTNSWFATCFNLQDIKDIRNLNTENVTDMSYMFNDCQSLTSLDLGNFNTQNVTNMRCMFCGCHALTSLDVSNFNTQNVTQMWMMFSGCKALTSLDVSNFNTQNVTDMSSMFDGCRALRWLDLSNFNTENVTKMSCMFYYCSALTSLDVSNFNTQNVTDMSSMFYGCESLTSIFCNNNWKVRNKIYDSAMFNHCTRLNGTNTAYNPHKIGIEMANPNTGYFTKQNHRY